MGFQQIDVDPEKSERLVRTKKILAGPRCPREARDVAISLLMVAAAVQLLAPSLTPFLFPSLLSR